MRRKEETGGPEELEERVHEAREDVVDLGKERVGGHGHARGRRWSARFRVQGCLLFVFVGERELASCYRTITPLALVHSRRGG